MQKKGKPKTQRLDMSKFAPPEVKRPTNCGLHCLPPNHMETSTTTTTSIADPKVANITMMVASTCRMCKRWGLHCPFCAQSTLHPSPVESDWSIEDCNGENKKLKRKRIGNKNYKPSRRKRRPGQRLSPY